MKHQRAGWNRHHDSIGKSHGSARIQGQNRSVGSAGRRRRGGKRNSSAVRNHREGLSRLDCRRRLLRQIKGVGVLKLGQAAVLESLDERQFEVGDKGAVRRDVRMEVGEELIVKRPFPEGDVDRKGNPAARIRIDLIRSRIQIDGVVKTLR